MNRDGGNTVKAQREPKHIQIMDRLHHLHAKICMLESLCDEISPVPPPDKLAEPRGEDRSPPTLGECLDHIFAQGIEACTNRVEQCNERLRSILF